jgi:uncharacterized protein YlxP (DUF503 family)
MAVSVGVLQLEILIPGSSSLKEKRSVLRSLKDRVRQKYNVAVAEVDNHDHWQIATLGIVTVSGEAPFCEAQLRKVLEFAETYRDAEVSDYQIDVL